jgi:hypothetical protein
VKQQPFIDRIYLLELRRQTTSAQLAHAEAMTALSAASVALVFTRLHAFLAHCANISKLLWPGQARNTTSRRRAKVRSAHLQKLLAEHLDSLAPLRSRALRDHLEHFDERLDDWAASAGNNFVDSNIAPLATFNLPFPSGPRLRHYDPTTAIFHFRDEGHSIAELRGAIDHLAAALPQR